MERKLLDEAREVLSLIGFEMNRLEPIAPELRQRAVRVLAQLDREIEARDARREPEGLYEKYVVYKRSAGPGAGEVSGCFVLRPGKDEAARVALRVYAAQVQYENPTLARELWAWMDRVERGVKK